MRLASDVLTPKARSAAWPVMTLPDPAYNSAAISLCSALGLPVCAT